MREFVMQLGHRPGELARVTNVLSFAGVNIKSVAAMAIGNDALVRLIPDNEQATRDSLTNAHIRFEEHDVISVLLENRAGELTGLAMQLANAGVNLLATYVVGVAGELIELAVVVDDTKKARKVLQ